jgi:hypothetical protein
MQHDPLDVWFKDGVRDCVQRLGASREKLKRVPPNFSCDRRSRRRSYTLAMLWQRPDTQALRIPTPTIAVQFAASLCIGMLVGIEREWAN